MDAKQVVMMVDKWVDALAYMMAALLDAGHLVGEWVAAMAASWAAAWAASTDKLWEMIAGMLMADRTVAWREASKAANEAVKLVVSMGR